jgi:hypothetical protein
MLRLLLDCWRVWLLGPSLAVALIGFAWLCQGPPPLAKLWYFTAAFSLLFAGAAHARLLRFVWSVRSFRRAATPQVIVYREPGVWPVWAAPSLLSRCEAELVSLKTWFGFPLRARPRVFVFRDCREIGRLFGERYGAIALVQQHTVLIAANNDLFESLRHELAHLFTARLNPFAPSLLNEGLAMHLQRTLSGQQLCALARPVLRDRRLCLAALLSERFFFAEPQRHACYILAGSFTDFLVRRYGWDCYRRLLRSQTRSVRGSARVAK